MTAFRKTSTIYDGTWFPDRGGFGEWEMVPRSVNGASIEIVTPDMMKMRLWEAVPQNVGASPEFIARLEAAEARAMALLEALRQCAEWFDSYAASHTAKGDTDKAKRNADRAEFARAAIAQHGSLQ